MKDKIAIGKILTTHGIKGFVKVRSFSGETEHFKKLKEVLIIRNDLEVYLYLDEIRIANKNMLIKFTGFDTPEKAKSLSGYLLWTDRENACKLKEGEYYIKDLCSCDVYKNGNIIGRIKSVFEGANSDNLEIILNNNKTVIIPFIEKFIGTVNIKEKRIFIKEDCGII